MCCRTYENVSKINKGELILTIDVDVFTGLLTYKNIQFHFIFDKEQLRLIPPHDKKFEVEKWFLKPIGNKGNYVGYTTGDPIYIEEPLVSDSCNERPKIVFIPKHSSVGRYNSVLIIDIQAYIVFSVHEYNIRKINFSCPEINSIFPSRQAIGEAKWDKDGEFSLKTQKLETSNENKQYFKYQGKDIEITFDIIQTTTHDVTKPPLSLQSCMCFKFGDTSDYNFIVELCNIAKTFINYISYRKDISFTNIQLYTPYDEGKKNYKGAELFLVEKQFEIDEKSVKDGRFIKHHFISDIEGKILNEIASQQLYLYHLPDSYERNHINAARFVMITAAFEWEFRKLYPNGISKETKEIQAEASATIVLKELVEKSTGKLKKLYKSLLKNGIGFLPLKAKIEQTCKDLDNIINPFGKYLYSINGEELKYSKVGERVSTQRNNYAHGNIDKEFVGLSMLDLIFLERVIYAMQLKRFGLSDINIKHSINELFHCNLIISEDKE